LTTTAVVCTRSEHGSREQADALRRGDRFEPRVRMQLESITAR
jgi:hypothetical protein